MWEVTPGETDTRGPGRESLVILVVEATPQSHRDGQQCLLSQQMTGMSWGKQSSDPLCNPRANEHLTLELMKKAPAKKWKGSTALPSSAKGSCFYLCENKRDFVRLFLCVTAHLF